MSITQHSVHLNENSIRQMEQGITLIEYVPHQCLKEPLKAVLVLFCPLSKNAER